MWRWRLRAQGTSDTNCVAATPSAEQPVNEADLAKGNGGDARPGQPFTDAQPGLMGFAEPELHLQRADIDGVAIAQDGLVNGLAVNGGQGFGLGTQHDALRGIEVELQM